ncbi:MAG: hypothetical protein N3B12_06645, partial [Armatimonadetes bacterium]|nr:hypothetical protein [Armatimonadota bacterium]
MYECEPQAQAIGSSLKNPPAYVYKTTFALQANGPVALHIKALRTFRLFVNNHFVGRNNNQSDWKKLFTFDIANYLKHGLNSIEIHVQNPWGPGLLYAYTRGLNREVTTNDEWKVEFEGKTSDAVRATDIITHPDSKRYSSLQVLEDEWPVVLVLFVCTAAALSLLRRYFRSSDKRSKLPKIAIICTTAFWILIFITKFKQIPIDAGFDAPEHLRYIDFILTNHSIPMANEGWSMYHPPLFYCLSALIFTFFGSLFGTNAAVLGLKTIPFVSGLGNVWISYFASRRLFNDDPKLVTLTVLSTGLIPMNIYMSAFISNESLHAFLISAAILYLITALLEHQTQLRTVLVIGLLIG